MVRKSSLKIIKNPDNISIESHICNVGMFTTEGIR